MTVLAPLARLIAAVDWPTLVAFLLAESVMAYLVVRISPRRAAEQGEERAERLFRRLAGLNPDGKESLLDAVRGAISSATPGADALRDAVHGALGAATPSPEVLAEAQAAQAQAIADAVGPAVESAIATAAGPAVESAVAAAVKGRMGALSAKGVEARTVDPDVESAIKEKIGAGKHGAAAIIALATWRVKDPKGYKGAMEGAVEAFTYAPESAERAIETLLSKVPGLGGGDGGSKTVKVL